MWNATVTDTSAGAHEFQFSVESAGGSAPLVRDFNVTKSFQWSRIRFEGIYQLGVVVRNVSTAETAHTTQVFIATSRLVGGRASGSGRFFMGAYHFEAGWILPGASSAPIEIPRSGVAVFEMQEQPLTYRSRLQDRYTPAP
jgi:hypothetical protein